MTLSGARPRGPRPELANKLQLELLQHLYSLNRPYRVSYEMVVRKVWSDHDDDRIRRARARDLSRQFRGEKRIGWNIIENYLELLFPDDQTQRTAHLARVRPLHVEAFGAAAPEEDDGVTGSAAGRIADLERQLVESRTRASFATALLVIVRSENAVLRGRHASFGWFTPRICADEGAGIDPATAPIKRPPPRGGPYRYWNGRPLVVLADLIGEQRAAPARRSAGTSWTWSTTDPAAERDAAACLGSNPAVVAAATSLASAEGGVNVVRAARAAGRSSDTVAGAEPDILTAGPQRRRRGWNR